MANYESTTNWNQAERNRHHDAKGGYYTGKKLNQVFKSNAKFKIYMTEECGLGIQRRNNSEHTTSVYIDPYVYPNKEENVTYLEAVISLGSYTSIMPEIRDVIESISQETIQDIWGSREHYLVLTGQVRRIVKEAPTSFLDKATDIVINTLKPLLSNDDDIEEFE